MGTEYRIRTEKPIAEAALDRLLRALPGFSRIEPSFGTYDFRAAENRGTMPDHSIKLEAAMCIYLCDYGSGAAAAVIGALMLHLVHQHDAPVHLELIE